MSGFGLELFLAETCVTVIALCFGGNIRHSLWESQSGNITLFELEYILRTEIAQLVGNIRENLRKGFFFKGWGRIWKI